MIISPAALRNEAERCGEGEETMAKVKRRRMLGQVERGLRTGCALVYVADRVSAYDNEACREGKQTCDSLDCASSTRKSRAFLGGRSV